MVYATLICIMALTPLLIIKRTWFIKHVDHLPKALAGEPLLEVQTEDFTCGVHAMSTIYRAYGLDPDKEKVRERLGADLKAIFWMAHSEGAFHPDAYMMFTQDYFFVEEVDFDAENPWRDLMAHLEKGQMTMLLIRMRETNGLHWVAARYHGKDQMEVFDSLAPQPLVEGRDYMEEYVLTAMMITPMHGKVQAMRSTTAHAAGTLELQRSMIRYASLLKGSATQYIRRRNAGG